MLPHQDELTAALEKMARACRAAGVLVYDCPTSEWSEVLVSVPGGVEGRKHALRLDLAAFESNAAVPAKDHLLPTALTRWLGTRPEWIWGHDPGAERPCLLLLFWGRSTETPQAPPIETVRVLPELIERHRELSRLHDSEARLDALLTNVSLGVVFHHAGKGSVLNPVAARILRLAEGMTDPGVIAEAMHQLRENSIVEEAISSAVSASDLLQVGDRPAARYDAPLLGRAEYWISRTGQAALRVESHAMGSTTNPGRVWIFTDVKPLWEATEQLREANLRLGQNLKLLAMEVERRESAEAELRRYNAGLLKTNEDLLAAKSESDHLASVDELTGLANRRSFNERFRMELSGVARHAEEIAVLLLDIDHFKKFNDRYGHLEGDGCLRRVARVLQGCIRRDADLVARYGGEEFVILLPATDLKGAENVAALILEELAGLAIPHADSRTGYVTASIGLTSCTPTSILQERVVLDEADRALYHAKTTGRNRYAVFALADRT